MRLIDADALGIGKCNPDVFDDKGYAKGWNSAIEILQNAPTVDAVPVVRCKDCKWYQESKLLAPNKFCFRLKGKDGEKVGYNFADDDFCSHGERKGGDE